MRKDLFFILFISGLFGNLFYIQANVLTVNTESGNTEFLNRKHMPLYAIEKKASYLNFVGQKIRFCAVNLKTPLILYTEEISWIDENSRTNIYKPKVSKPKKDRNGNIYVEVETDIKELWDKIFVISDVMGGDYSKEEEMVRIDHPHAKYDRYITFKLRDEENTTVYWTTLYADLNDQKYFIFERYIEDQINFFKNETLIYRNYLPGFYSRYKNTKGKEFANLQAQEFTEQYKKTTSVYTDEKGGKKSFINLSEWTWVDWKIADSDFYHIYKNILGEMILLPPEKMTDYGFIFKSAHLEEQRIRKLKSAEITQLDRQYKDRIELEKKLRSDFSNDLNYVREELTKVKEDLSKKIEDLENEVRQLKRELSN